MKSIKRVAMQRKAELLEEAMEKERLQQEEDNKKFQNLKKAFSERFPDIVTWCKEDDIAIGFVLKSERGYYHMRITFELNGRTWYANMNPFKLIDIGDGYVSFTQEMLAEAIYDGLIPFELPLTR